MEQHNPFLEFQISAGSFLGRSKRHLEEFDKTEAVDHFFYAALELRFGIEARLNEYLKAALRSLGRDPNEIPEYVASKLLRRLLTIDPDAGEPSTLRITNEQSGHSFSAKFTPVSPRLAAIHGQLGELLHFKFFTNNRNWLVRKPLGGKPHRSVADYLVLLREGIAELEYATSGSLLFNPRFKLLVEEISSEASDEK